jgi:hypothetical protein
MGITIKILPRFGIKSKVQFLKELEPEKLNPKIIRFNKNKHVINALYRIVIIGLFPFPVIVYDILRNADSILIIPILIHTLIFVLGLSFYYNFILFNFLPIFTQYILYLCLWIGMAYLEYLGINNIIPLLIFRFILIFHLEFKSGKWFSQKIFDLLMIPTKYKICPYCKETISEDIINKAIDEGYVHCPSCRNQILKDELSDFDENHLRKEHQFILKKISNSKKLPE